MNQPISTSSADFARELRLDQLRMLIGGELVAGGGHSPIEDPATGETILNSPTASPEQVRQAVAAARAAARTWGRSDHAERAAVVEQIADALISNLERLATLVVLEQGKPIEEARSDVTRASEFARYMAGLRLECELLVDDATHQVWLSPRPLGVVAAIVPWNFPLYQAVFKMVQAVMAGNSVIVKPAPTSPLSALALGEYLAHVVPPGLVNVIGDDGQVGPLLVDADGIDKVSFTGSTATGRLVMAGAARTLKRLTLELGGNDAAIVLDDVDVSAVAEKLVATSFKNAGQVCISSKRIFAPREIYEDLAEAMGNIVAQFPLGHGLDPATRLGPVQNRKQFEAASRWLEQARHEGRIVTGGRTLDRPGYFVEPTLVTDLQADASLLSDEVFAPIRSVIPYDVIDHAIDAANASPYGLGASVWSSDRERALKLADQLDAGTVWINQHGALRQDVPYGGMKQSGFGMEFGQAGLREYTSTQVISVLK